METHARFYRSSLRTPRHQIVQMHSAHVRSIQRQSISPFERVTYTSCLACCEMLDIDARAKRGLLGHAERGGVRFGHVPFSCSPLSAL